MTVRGIVAVVAAVHIAGATAREALAQSAQPFSVQASLLAASQKIGKSAISGFGFEGQLRYTPLSLWSLGVGVQYSAHSSGDESIDITGVFLEPRYAVDIGSDRFAPYLAGRLAFLRESATLFQDPQSPTVLLEVSSNGSAFGAGAGLLIRGSARVNIDIGAAFVSQSFGDASSQGTTFTFARFTGYVAKAGVSIGFGSR